MSRLACYLLAVYPCSPILHRMLYEELKASSILDFWTSFVLDGLDLFVIEASSKTTNAPIVKARVWKALYYIAV